MSVGAQFIHDTRRRILHAEGGTGRSASGWRAQKWDAQLHHIFSVDFGSEESGSQRALRDEDS